VFAPCVCQPTMGPTKRRWEEVSYRRCRWLRGVRVGLFGSTGYPAASQASIPPINALACRNPFCESVDAILALVASSGQAQ
jgi:hypothetical protein